MNKGAKTLKTGTKYGHEALGVAKATQKAGETYSSATKTITFSGVQGGTYALKIKNIGVTTASGYGSIND
ncbi:hypothetical protein [Paenibacillus sp. GCM10028914]|uniref:hypothetical protein n=1 Tax=Paenibacillus sp. GCM10028914 TaxID=3273416 RepID=UPI00360FB6B1